MNGREPDLLRVRLRVAFGLGVEVAQQRKFTEELLGGLILVGKAGDLLEIFQPRVVVGEFVL